MAKSGGGGGRTPAGSIPPMKSAGPPPTVNTEKSGKPDKERIRVQANIKARLDRLAASK